MIPCIYEMALKQNPNNEELYSHLFMAYVRIGDYKKQQQVNVMLPKLMTPCVIPKTMFEDVCAVFWPLLS